MPIDTRDPRLERERIVRHLHALIAALDRRVPQIERLGEQQIARDAASLKQRAQARLDELRGLSGE